MTIKQVLINIIANVRGFNQGISMTQKRFQRMETTSGKLDKRFKEMSTSGGRFALRLRQMTVGMRGFKMEFLSVMFFGLAIKNLFSGLLRPALELVGVFDLWRTTLQILFLPIALFLLDNVFIPLINVVGNMSEKTKKMIGFLALAGVAFGALLFIIGTVALGIGGLILAFGGLFGIIDRLIPDISVAGVNMSSFVEAGLAIGLVTKLWDVLRGLVANVWKQLKESPIIKDLLEKLGIESGELSEMWVKIKDRVKEFFEPFKEQIKEAKKEAVEMALSVKGIGNSINELVPVFNNLIPILENVNKLMETLARNKRLIQGALAGGVAGFAVGGPAGAVVGAAAGGIVGTGADTLRAIENIQPSNTNSNNSVVVHINVTSGISHAESFEAGNNIGRMLAPILDDYASGARR